MTYYYHLRRDSVAVEVGDVVTRGQLVGLMGSSGNSSDAHLHWSVYYKGMRVEPTEVKNLTLSMVIGLSIAAGGVVLWFVAGWWAKRPKKEKAEPRGFPVEGAIGGAVV